MPIEQVGELLQEALTDPATGWRIGSQLTEAIAQSFPPAQTPALHIQAIEAGVDPARAWRLTPREIVREADASGRRRAADQLVLAWYVARFERAKRLPRLETLLKDLRKPGRRRTRQGVSVDQVATINALMGGRDLRRGSRPIKEESVEEARA